MKNLVCIGSVAAAIFILFQSFIPHKVMRKDGTDPGYTGSPGDSFKNCTFCHGGTASPIQGWVTSNIPISGYVPGQTYTITATNTEAGGTRFGFEVSPQDIAGNLLGTLVVINNRTKLVGNNKYITYTSNGVDGQGFNVWSFDWIAPPSGTGEVVFYGAFNSNFEGHKGGDRTFLSNLTVKENTTSGIIGLPRPVSRFKVYPNPASDVFTINLEINKVCFVQIEMIDINGKRVAILSDGKQLSGTFIKQFNITSLANGNYLVRVNINGETVTQKMSILH